MSYKRHDLSENFNTGEIKLNYITCAQYEGDWKSILHTHQCTELFYILSGEGTFQIQKKSFFVSENDIIIINPNIEHTEKVIDEKAFNYMVLGIQGNIPLLDNLGYCFFNCAEINDDIQYYTKEILNEIENPTSYSDVISQSFLHILIAKLLRHYNIQIENSSKKSTISETHSIKKYIDHHFAEEINLETLAKIAHLNKYYLAHTFTSENGISPINYLIKRRLQESRFLLTSFNYSIAEVAQMSGFSSSSYFSQCFSKFEGMTPNQYRKNFRHIEKK